MVPTLKFSVTTSARVTSSLNSSTPFGVFSSSVTAELVALAILGGRHPLLDTVAHALDPQRHPLAAAVARLDLDDACAEVGQQHRAERHGDDLAEIQHGDVAQRLFHASSGKRQLAHRGR